jgi:hypothetical protein
MLLGVNGGLGSGGVGSCKMGSGGALLARGSVTPGILGIRGPSDNPRGFASGTGEQKTRAVTAAMVKI